MNTQHYCAMFDTATFHYLASLGGLNQLKSIGLGWADRRQTITYEREVLAGELVLIRTCRSVLAAHPLPIFTACRTSKRISCMRPVKTSLSSSI